MEATVVFIVLAAPVVFALAAARFVDSDAGGWPGVALIGSITALEVGLTALAFWAMRARGDALGSIGVIKPQGPWLLVAVVGVVILGALAVLRIGNLWSGLAGTSDIGAVAHDDTQRVTLLFLSVPQIYLQELLYRGFAITWLERLTGSTWLAVVVSGSAFALAHVTSLAGNLAVSLLSVAAVGSLLGWLYVATRDLLPVFTLHWLWVAWMTVALSVDLPDHDAVAKPALPD